MGTPIVGGVARWPRATSACAAACGAAAQRLRSEVAPLPLSQDHRQRVEDLCDHLSALAQVLQLDALESADLLDAEDVAVRTAQTVATLGEARARLRQAAAAIRRDAGHDPECQPASSALEAAAAQLQRSVAALRRAARQGAAATASPRR